MSRRLASRRFHALGSTCELLSLDLGPPALARCERKVREAEASLTRFDAASELSLLNQSGGLLLPITAGLFAMLEAALWAYEESDGLVNAAVLPALRGCGYDRPFASGLLEPASIEPQPVPSLPDVLRLEQTTRSAALAPGAALDLGGIAKGALADQLIDELGGNALCNLGGDLRVRGAGPDGDGWHIGLCDGSRVALTEGAVCTSGTTRRRWGSSMHHLIDPRRGLPALTDLAEVSVVADTGLRGEVYAKCAMLLGQREGRALLESHAAHFTLLMPGADAFAPRRSAA